ncbi:histidine phosphatase family protein, partial [Janibacter hoylei]
MTETTRRLSAEADGGSKGEPRRLIVLRHGQTGSNLKGIWQGQLDHELTDLGREQARAAAAAIASLRPTRVVSSDLVRARDTAEEVAAASGGL